MGEGPRMERMVGIDTRAWNNPTETSSIITWNKVTINILIKVHLSSVVSMSTLKNRWMKVREASAKTTVARKVEKAPWKTWGPVLVGNFISRVILGRQK